MQVYVPGMYDRKKLADKKGFIDRFQRDPRL